jgi:hypothetical protein
MGSIEFGTKTEVGTWFILAEMDISIGNAEADFKGDE